MEIVSKETVNKKKCCITFDNGEKIALYNKEADRYGLENGNMLTKEAYEEIRTEILLPRAKRRVLYLLQSADRTEAWIRQKLREGYFPDDIIEAAIDYAKSFRYIDDERYARNYASFSLNGKSRRVVEMELYKKGISREAISEIMDEIPAEREKDTIEKLIRKKHLEPGERDEQKIMKVKQFLLRKGFSYDTINSVMRHYLEDC